MAIHWISSDRIEQRRVTDLPALLARDDGIVWVDIPYCDEDTSQILGKVFACHPLAIRDCKQYNLIPKLHAYPEHLFIILHSLEVRAENRLILAELDQFIGKHYLVTVHTLPDEKSQISVGMRETKAILARIESGHWYPRTPGELSFAIVSAINRNLESFLSTLRLKAAQLERDVVDRGLKHPERDLEEMFTLRHELITVKTMANQSREIFTRVVNLAPRFLPPEGRPYMEDILDQFSRIQSMCEAEKEFLQGIIDFYQTRTSAKMNIAMERLALLTSLLLPITAVSSIYGMNIIVNDHTDVFQLIAVLLTLAILTFLMFRWAQQHGWWQ